MSAIEADPRDVKHENCGSDKVTSANFISNVVGLPSPWISYLAVVSVAIICGAAGAGSERRIRCDPASVRRGHHIIEPASNELRVAKLSLIHLFVVDLRLSFPVADDPLRSTETLSPTGIDLVSRSLDRVKTAERLYR